MMTGFRGRIGFLVPPGNPTVEPEMTALAPPGVSLHFTRMTAGSGVGTHDGQEERNRAQIDGMAGCVELLSKVSPSVIVMAHAATSYTLRQAGEAALVARMEALGRTRFVTAMGAVLASLAALGVRRIAYATPYSAAMTLAGVQHLTACGIEVVSHGALQGVRNIYEETPDRAYAIGREVDRPEAEAVFLSGTGMPTLPILQMLEDDLGKPVFSAATAMMWHALQVAGVHHAIIGYGKLMGLCPKPRQGPSPWTSAT